MPILSAVRSNDTYPFHVSPAFFSYVTFLVSCGEARCGNTHPPLAIYNFHFQNIYLKPATVNCVASVKPPKKAGRPVMIELNPNFEILSQMRNLQITFLNDDGQCAQALSELQTMTKVRAPSLTTLILLDSKSFCQLLSTDLTIG